MLSLRGRLGSFATLEGEKFLVAVADEALLGSKRISGLSGRERRQIGRLVVAIVEEFIVRVVGEVSDAIDILPIVASTGAGRLWPDYADTAVAYAQQLAWKIVQLGALVVEEQPCAVSMAERCGRLLTVTEQVRNTYRKHL